MMMLNLLLTFMKIGALGFGGGLAIVTLIYDSIQQFSIISQSQFADIVAISQVTPGPLAINVATYIGYIFDGIPGSVVATIGVGIPAFILVGIVCRMMEQFRNSRIVDGALKGIRPATIGLIGAATITLALPAIAGESRLASGLISSLAGTPVDFAAILIAAVTAVLIGKYKKNPFAVLIIMGCIGAVIGV